MSLSERDYMKRDDNKKVPPKADSKYEKETFDEMSGNNEINRKFEYKVLDSKTIHDTDIQKKENDVIFQFLLLIFYILLPLLIFGIFKFFSIGTLSTLPIVIPIIILSIIEIIKKKLVGNVLRNLDVIKILKAKKLNYERPLWIQETDLDKDIIIKHDGKKIKVIVPSAIREEREMNIRLKGLGKNAGGKKGDLILNVKLYQRENISHDLWISEEAAKKGVDKKLLLKTGTKITVKVPPNSVNGSEILMEKYTESILHTLKDPYVQRHIGDIKIQLFVFPNYIQPRDVSFNNLTTEEMALEGWVYRKLDEIYNKLGKKYFPDVSTKAWEMADLFNEYGWKEIFNELCRRLNLTCSINAYESSTIKMPGICNIRTSYRNNVPVYNDYKIEINRNFIHNPIFVTAILAHELCHIVSNEKLNNGMGSSLKDEKEKLENERLVDLLVFLFGLGDFQLRAAREERITFGYFDQKMFERIGSIVSKL